jgi:DnaK suppressor protein
MTTTRQHVSDTTHMERYAVLRDMLEERRREIHEKLRSLREAMPEEASIVRDSEEQSVNDFVRDVDFALMQMKSETLVRIDEALHRLEEGTYGICQDCGNDVPEPRLKALPFATRCRQCQERFETAQEEGGRGEAPAVGARLQQALALTQDREARNE